MTTKPEALRLADELIEYIDGPAFHAPHWLVRQSAAELRRLHEEVFWLQDKLAEKCRRTVLIEALNQELLEALKHSREGIRQMTSWELPDDKSHPWTDCLKQIDAAIAKAEGNEK